MALYRTISVGSVIAKLYRDLNLEDYNFINDAIEWTGEVLEHIGAYPQLEKKEAVLEVEDFKVAIPSDLFALEQISYSPSDDVTVDTFKDSPKHPLPESKATVHKGLHIGISGERPIVWEHSFIANPNFWHFTFETGIIGVSYLAISLDENGYPNIPDDISYKEATTWYILNKLILGGYKHIDPNINFMTTRQLWLNYCTQARNKALIQSIGDLERFHNNWVRLVQRTDTSFNFFREQYINYAIVDNYGNQHIDITLP